ncbi:hypothetical protein V8F06_008643 [Rhypophila decipiens]
MTTNSDKDTKMSISDDNPTTVIPEEAQAYFLISPWDFHPWRVEGDSSHGISWSRIFASLPTSRSNPDIHSVATAGEAHELQAPLAQLTLAGQGNNAGNPHQAKAVSKLALGIENAESLIFCAAADPNPVNARVLSFASVLRNRKDLDVTRAEVKAAAERVEEVDASQYGATVALGNHLDWRCHRERKIVAGLKNALSGMLGEVFAQQFGPEFGRAFEAKVCPVCFCDVSLECDC